MRGLFRKDLPQYHLPKQSTITCKCKLTGSNSANPKKILTDAKTTRESLLNKAVRKRNWSKSKQCGDERPKKKLCTCAVATNTPRQQSRTWPFRFNPVNEEWQCNL